MVNCGIFSNKILKSLENVKFNILFPTKAPDNCMQIPISKIRFNFNIESKDFIFK